MPSLHFIYHLQDFRQIFHVNKHLLKGEIPDPVHHIHTQRPEPKRVLPYAGDDSSHLGREFRNSHDSQRQLGINPLTYEIVRHVGLLDVTTTKHFKPIPKHFRRGKKHDERSPNRGET